jgi:preprotein translocase subunit SecB
MADTPNPETGTRTETGEASQQFAIQKIYIKDVSFESPNAPTVFTREWHPDVNLDLNTNAQPIGEGVYEVVLSLTATVKNQDETAFLVEVQQAGIFSIGGFSDADMGQMLGSFCPNILFPYAREAISDLVTKGGFMPLLLAPVNFDALYAQHLAQQQKAEAAETPAH